LDSETVKIQSELARRHKAAATTVGGLIIATVLLSIIAFLGKDHLLQQQNPPLSMAVSLTILFLGIGSIVWRRTKFATMRLQDIGALQGPVGLLTTLEKTTIQTAFIGATIATVGFVATLMTGDPGFTYRASAIALVVLVYTYPTKSSWNRVVHAFVQEQIPSNSAE
jgi:hypothetical protein